MFILTPLDILFGANSNYIQNLIITLGKLHIYKAKMNEKKPDLEVFKQELKYYYNTLKYTALCNLQIQLFNKRWTVWANIIK